MSLRRRKGEKKEKGLLTIPHILNLTDFIYGKCITMTDLTVNRSQPERIEDHLRLKLPEVGHKASLG